MDSTGTNAQTGTIAIGQSALTALTSGARNTALGYSALAANQAGDDNTVIGYNALTAGGASNADLDKNIAIGNYALDAADGAEANNMAIGYGSLGNLNNSSATRNIAIGNNAAAHMGSGLVHVDNVFLGYSAAGAEGASATWANNLSAYNVGIGNYVMDAVMDGALNNTAVGHNSLTALTSGDNNVAVGAEALDELLTGANNTAVGKGALNQLDAAESENTAIGTVSGSDLDGGSNNVFVGHNSQPSTAAATNQIVIGHDTTGQADNSVTLGNADVTAVYMASDSGAKVWCSEVDISHPSSHARIFIDSASTSYASWVEHQMGGASKWLAGMEGSSTQYRLYDSSDSSVAVHVAAGGSSWVNDSDERMKKDIVPMEDRLSDLMKIKVRRFKWKKNDKEDFGFVAQELESCVPEAVEKGDDDVYTKEEADDSVTAVEGALKNPYGVSRELLIPMMIKAIQELTAKVEALEAK